MEMQPIKPTAPVMMTQVMLVLGPNRTRIICPNCHTEVRTRINYEASEKTHLIAVLLCCLCCLGCIPYCVDSCQNANHYCPKCHKFLGTYK